jgi:hypothetical protein
VDVGDGQGVGVGGKGVMRWKMVSGAAGKKPKIAPDLWLQT